MSDLIQPPAPEVHARDLPTWRLLFEMGRSSIGVWSDRVFDQLYPRGRAFGLNTILINDPEGVRHVLTAPPGLYNRPAAFARLIRPLGGTGLLLAEGETWRRQRRQMAPLFTPANLGALLPHFILASQTMAGRLRVSRRANLSRTFHEYGPISRARDGPPCSTVLRNARMILPSHPVPAAAAPARNGQYLASARCTLPLPLFAAAEGQPAPETNDQAVALKAMTAGHEVIEDYGHVGLTLRRHPVSFLRDELSKDRMLTCTEANRHPDRRRIKLAGLVLVRQRPGTAKGVTFITIEDETGVANLVVWADLYERQRRIVLTANMLGVEGRVQREGLVVHIVADKLIDLSDRLASIGETDRAVIPAGRGDNFRGYMPPDPRAPKPSQVKDADANTLKLKPRNFH